MACFHLHGDDAGETHITLLDLPVHDSEAGTVRGLHGIPATTVGFGEFIGRKPDIGTHNAPRRQFLIVLQGELEIVTTLQQVQRLRPGDVLLADDVGTKGHISRDVGGDPLMMMAIGLDPGWPSPRTAG
ncbi:MAG TPA: hypothetical protein VFI47_17995 [Acidimicrobiales bacterium]|nr:hypothetical protein [Acidimicrobiales bacterium]